FVALVAQDVHGLGVIVLHVLVVAAASGLSDRDGRLAIFEPLFGQGRFVFAGREHAGDSGGGERRSFAAASGMAALSQAVDDAAGLGGAVLQIFMGFVDDALGHGDAGV